MMKHITLSALLLLTGVSTQAQVVFESDLETWTDALPDDFMGTKTNIAATAVTQVTENPHGGAFAVRLENATTTHKRFTTQPVEVTIGQAYEVSFWVRGEGEVRVGLYDGRPGTSSGYAPYTNYTVITGDAWQEVSLSMIAAYDTIGGEFILSVRNTLAPEHLVVDDVNISIGSAPGNTSIYGIQYTTAVDGASPLSGQSVTTSGIVTAVFPSDGADPGYFIQDGAGAWNGIYVYDQSNVPAIGDSVTVSAVVTEYFTLTELTSVALFTVESIGNTPPAAVTATSSGAASEQYEGTLVTVINGTCTDPSAANGQWIIDDTSGPLFVSPLIFDFTATQGTNYDVTGPMFYSFGESKILPRSQNDVVVATGIGELAGAIVTLFPNPANNVMTLDLGGLSGRTEYTLHDATGRLVASDVITRDRGTIDVSALTNGAYVMTLRNSTGARWSTQVIVQH